MHLELLEPFARTIVTALGVGILESMALALLVLTMTKMKPRPSATTRHVLWWLTLSASAILPAVSVFSSLGHIEHQRVPVIATSGPSGVEMRRIENVQDSVEATPRAARENYRTPATDAFAPLSAALARSLPSPDTLRYLGLACLALWLLVAAGGFVSLTRSLIVLRRIKLAALPLDASVVRRLRRWRHSSRLGRSVALSVSNEVDVPVAVGFRLPTILLPAQLVEIEEIADIDQIAMHEYAHLDRYDDWTNLLQRFIERLFWFNPVIAFVGHRISLEREIACDDWVVAQTGRAHRYATCLWKLVESSRLPAKPILAPGALLSPKQITIRIEQLLDARRNALPRLSPIGALVVGALCIALIVVQVQRAPVIALVESAPAVTLDAAEPAASPAAGARPEPSAQPAKAKPTSPSEAERIAAERIALAAERVKLETARAQLDASSAEHAAVVASSSQQHSKQARPAAKEAITIAVVSPDQPSGPATFAIPDAQIYAPGIKRPFDRELRASALATARLGALPSQIARVFVLENGLRATLSPAFVSPPPARTIRAGVGSCIGCDLSHANLHALNLSHIMLTGASLRGADLTGANLNGARLIGVDLREAKLDGADLRNAVISNSDLSGSSFRNVRIDGIRIAATIFSGMIAEGTHLRQAIDHCQGCDLHLLDLHGQDLHGVHLTGADLHGADLRDVELSEAVFDQVDLHDARFTGADLHNAKLRSCNLNATDFKGANMVGLSTEGSDTGATARVGFSLHLFKVKAQLQKPAQPATDEAVSDLDITVDQTDGKTPDAPARAMHPVNDPSHSELD
jgi:uncharacterized protein YjbI with pentapeptide repeats/beta-lactamase regulating signal transducer with metallopeptidase domain